MRYWIALIALGAALAGAISPAFAQGGELTCAADTGPLLVFGSEGAERLRFVGPNRERVLQLKHWRICFRCAGFPSLQLDLVDVDGSGGDVRVGGEVKLCGKDDAAVSEKYCIVSAGVWPGNKPSQPCRFPEGTTLGQLWTALTQSSPPEKVDLWWAFPTR
ncbi:exported hypothetical protein [Candidatus Terasakiella magnetica]|nr:exported hypothetical protein [Candidatus Terasakiella magnetica]